MRARLALALLFSLATVSASARALDLDDYPDVRLFLQDMEARYDFARPDLERWFRQAQLRPEIIEAMDKPKETLPWFQYRKLFLTQDRVDKGVAFWRKNAQALDRAYEQFGVEPEIIVAILSIETQLGRHTGRFPVIDALTTLAFKYPSRSPYFRQELEQYLLLARDLGIDPTKPKGSYAGAMGIGQFMPTSYRLFAIDFDGDKKRDLFLSTEDAIGSVANYFKHYGWERGQPISDDALVAGDDYQKLRDDGVEPRFDLVRLRKKFGITPVQQTDDKERASLIVLEGDNGPLYRLAYHNFYVLTHYNRSKLYAMAAYELSRRLRERYHGTTS
jgi:membrane-bound lytic murein transglycosylase B